MPDFVNVLFLCTGNSCRSQIAEGWMRALGGESFGVQSAGIEAHGQNPRAISVMREAGIDISSQESTVVTPEMIEAADIVVTVCGHAEEQCPALPRRVKKFHWALADPARAGGTDEQIMAAFRATRNEIEARVRRLITELEQGTVP